MKSLLDTHDIILLQELMIHECDVGILYQLNQDFTCNVGVSDRVNDGIVYGRPSRGVSILYRKYLLSNIKHVAIYIYIKLNVCVCVSVPLYRIHLSGYFKKFYVIL